tara:strand:- start:1371 stop:1508 length:138 start_codon:yes stop_codon:yes gene_type:complete
MAKKQTSKPQVKPINRQQPKTLTDNQKGQTIPRPTSQLNINPKKK